MRNPCSSLFCSTFLNKNRLRCPRPYQSPGDFYMTIASESLLSRVCMLGGSWTEEESHCAGIRGTPRSGHQRGRGKQTGTDSRLRGWEVGENQQSCWYGLTWGALAANGIAFHSLLHFVVLLFCCICNPLKPLSNVTFSSSHELKCMHTLCM